MTTLRFAAASANMADPDLFGFGHYLTDPDPLAEMTPSRITLVDRGSGARLSLVGAFTFETDPWGDVYPRFDSPVTGIELAGPSGETLFSWTSLALTLYDFASAYDLGELAAGLLEGDDSIAGSPQPDMLFGDLPDWHQELVTANPLVAGQELAMSADGAVMAGAVQRWLVPGDGFQTRVDVVLIDRVTGAQTVMSSLGGSEAALTWAENPSLSSDGARLVFRTNDPAFGGSTDIPPVWTIVARDTVGGGVSLMSTNADGEPADADCSAPVISADGTTIAFTSRAHNLVEAVPQVYFQQVFAKDFATGAVSLVSSNAAGEAADRDAFGSAVSGDGRYVAFASLATNLVDEVVPLSGVNLYVKDLATGTVRFVAELSPYAFLGEPDELGLAMSLDGKVVAFTSWSADLVPGDTNGEADIFVARLEDGSIERVTVDQYGQQVPVNAGSSSMALSGDGAVVAFHSRAGGLTGGSPYWGSVYVRDFAVGDIVRLSDPMADVMWSPVALSADGLTVAFTQTVGGVWSPTPQLVVASLHGEGADTVAGGGGDDLYFAETHDTIVELPGQGDDTLVTVWSEFTLPANVEHLLYGGHGFFHGTGNDGANLVSGGSLGDTLEGGDGDDTLAGGAGRDSIDGGEGDDAAMLVGGAGAHSLRFAAEGALIVDGPDGAESLRGIERLEFDDRVVHVASRGHGSYADLPESLYHFFIVAFNAAPGVEYMDQLAEAYRWWLPYYGDATVQRIVDVFTTKGYFTQVYPEVLLEHPTHEQLDALADRLMTQIVKDSATDEARQQAIGDVVAAWEAGWGIGRIVYQVFGNLGTKPLDDPMWGDTARQFRNEIEVARHYTEVLGQCTDDMATLRAVLWPVNEDTDVSSAALIEQLIGDALMYG